MIIRISSNLKTLLMNGGAKKLTAVVAIITLHHDLQNPHRRHHSHHCQHHHHPHQDDDDDDDPYVRVEDIEDGVCPVALGFVKLPTDFFSARGRKHRDLLPDDDHEEVKDDYNWR